MNAYIDIKPGRHGGFYAEVVTEQDYHEGGPFAHSHRTLTMGTEIVAQTAAAEWARKMSLAIVAPDEI